MGELESYVRAMVEERRKQPTDDLLSTLIAVEEDGDQLSIDELVTMSETILMAGTDTTRNQLACSIAVLLNHPDQWTLLSERPELAPKAVEETMRHVATLRGALRFVSEEIVYRDVLFPKGTLVWASAVTANRDPEVFPSPDSFDITAERSAQQMAFASGIHYCLGASLARAELQEAFVLLSQRMPNLPSMARSCGSRRAPASGGRRSCRFGSSSPVNDISGEWPHGPRLLLVPSQFEGSARKTDEKGRLSFAYRCYLLSSSYTLPSY